LLTNYICIYNTKLRVCKILKINKNFYLFVKKVFVINIFEQFDKYNNFKLVAILFFLIYYNIVVTKTCLLKLLIIRVLFSAFIESILSIKITSNLVLIFENFYNSTIAIYYIFIFFFYIYIILLEFNFTILDFDFKDFDCKNLTNFDFAILNILVNNKLYFFFIIYRY